MVRKVIAYQKLLNSMQMYSKGISLKVYALIFLAFLSIIVNGMVGFRYSFAMYFFISILFFGTHYMTNVRKTLYRNLPVSDRFVVLNCIIVMPLCTLIGVLMIISLIGAISYIISNISSGIWTSMYEAIFYDLIGLKGSINVYGCIWAILLAVTIWFVFCAAVFSRKKYLKIMAIVAFVGIYTLIEVVMINSARKNGYYGGIKLSDIVDIFPKYALVFSMIIITIISGILCYKYCVKMLRYDIKGQSTVTNDEAKNLSEFNKMTKANIRGNSFSKKNVIIIMALIGTFAFVFMISGTLGDFYNVDASNKIEQITTNIEDYKNWDMNDEFGWSYSDTSTFIFPEEIDSKNVVSYNAAKYGVKNQNLDKAHRILVQNFSKEEFETERKRIAGISYESPDAGKVNYIIHDTKHFKNEAYIAIYDDFLYEYAIMDEEKLQITYLYCYFEKPGIVFKDYNVSPVWTESVISIENANTDLKGYDIRSFYDEENGWYEIMDEHENVEM